MYRVATHLVEEFWGRPRDLADAVGVLLLTWNQALYRYGAPDFQRLERFLAKEAATLEALRDRAIETLTTADDDTVRLLFDDALTSLETRSNTGSRRRSPVAVAKALHLLAPRFFPLWDAAIARAYGCSYARQPAAWYLAFMRISREMVASFERTIRPLLGGKTPLKVLDEYNYARFTKAWV